jgi:hypothetical protein
VPRFSQGAADVPIPGSTQLNNLVRYALKSCRSDRIRSVQKENAMVVEQGWIRYAMKMTKERRRGANALFGYGRADYQKKSAKPNILLIISHDVGTSLALRSEPSQKQKISSDIFATAPGALKPSVARAFFDAFTIPGGPQSMILVSGPGAGSFSFITSAVTNPLP